MCQNHEVHVFCQAMRVFVIEQINYGADSGGTQGFYWALKTRVWVQSSWRWILHRKAFLKAVLKWVSHWLASLYSQLSAKKIHRMFCLLWLHFHINLICFHINKFCIQCKYREAVVLTEDRSKYLTFILFLNLLPIVHVGIHFII